MANPNTTLHIDPRPTALQMLVEATLKSRDGYDGERGRHEVAERVARNSNWVHHLPSDFYRMHISTKLQRALIAAERGEVHWDSLLDLCGYMALLADWHAQQKTAE